MSEMAKTKPPSGAEMRKWNQREIGLDRSVVQALCRRSDTKGLIYFLGWLALTIGAGFLLHLSLGSLLVVPAMMLYGAILVFSYPMSHETAHGTAFRRRWLNEAVFWFTSLIYGQEPNYRRFSHATHHTHTAIHGLDSQMAWQHPLTLGGYLEKISGIDQVIRFPALCMRHATGNLPDAVKAFTPQREWPRLIWGARLFLGIHLGLIAGFALAGVWWIPFVFLYLPRIIGGPLTNNVFDVTQHAEMREEVLDMRENTRSVRTNWFTNFIYSNMSYHLEHHLYPTVPFHALPALNREIRDRLPEPSPGFYYTNVQILRAIMGRMRESTAEITHSSESRVP